MEKLTKKNKKLSVFDCVLFVILLAYSISFLLPIIWGLISSFKDRGDFFINIIGFPKEFVFTNYTKAFTSFVVRVSAGMTTREVNLAEMLLNSVIYTGTCVFLEIASQCVVAYLCAKYRYKFSKFAYCLVIVSIIVPIVGNMPSMLYLLKTLGLYDTYFGIVAMKLNFTSIYFLIFYAIFCSLSSSYAEAALIDGASNTRIMFSIMIPMIAPTIAAVSFLIGIKTWNEYTTSMIFWPSRPTAAFGMFLYRMNPLVNSVPAQLTGNMIMIVPMAILFIFVHKKMVGNVTIGGLKG